MTTISRDRVGTILSGVTRTGRVANAYLFVGGEMEAKLKAALDFAGELNCTSDVAKPCGECLSCRKLAGGVHPDILVIGKDEASFKIDQVRELKELAKFGPSESAYKVIIVNDAETMTEQASNSFLKVLEEPPAGVVFILISDREEGIMRTILSRCQRIVFPDPAVGNAAPELRPLYDALRRRPDDFIGNTEALNSQPDLDRCLTELFTLFAQDRDPRSARTVLEALHDVKKRSNKKIAVDWMCLNLWKTN
ncbi:MAG TPA: DNA polymerase III subunit [Candidatus Omnitrophota bacterium]|nr:DNA polymerase III subunit [Candidatus Omnitrophota bacterium]